MENTVDSAIVDFDKSLNARIDLSDFVLAEFADLDLEGDEDDVLLSLDGGKKRVRLVDLSLADLDASDFLF